MEKEFDLATATKEVQAEGIACLAQGAGNLDGSFLLNYTPFQLQEIRHQMISATGPNLMISTAGNVTHFSFENKNGSTTPADKDRCSYDLLYDIAPPWDNIP